MLPRKSPVVIKHKNIHRIGMVQGSSARSPSRYRGHSRIPPQVELPIAANHCCCGVSEGAPKDASPLGCSSDPPFGDGVLSRCESLSDVTTFNKLLPRIGLFWYESKPAFRAFCSLAREWLETAQMRCRCVRPIFFSHSRKAEAHSRPPMPGISRSTNATS